MMRMLFGRGRQRGRQREGKGSITKMDSQFEKIVWVYFIPRSRRGNQRGRQKGKGKREVEEKSMNYALKTDAKKT